MGNNHDNSSSDFVFFAVVGTIFVIAIVFVLLWLQSFSLRVTADSGVGYNGGRKMRLTATPDLGEAAVEGEGETVVADAGTIDAAGTDLDAVIAAIEKGGCTACHTIPNIPNAIGQVGPDLSKIGTDGATRQDGYSAEEYIRESLREPSAFIAPECPLGPCVAGTMPQLTLDQSEIETIVSYLSTLGGE